MTAGRPKIEHDNRPAKGLLSLCVNYAHACDSFPFFDNLCTGAANVSLTGSTRPLSKKTLFHIVKTLDTISVESVQALTSYSLSHARKICPSARILSKSFQTFTENRHYTIAPFEGLDYDEYRQLDKQDYYQIRLLEHVL